MQLPCRWHKAVDKVRAALPAHVTTQSWKMHIFSQLPYPDNYKAFKQRRGRSLKPLETPQRLAALPSGLDSGQVPSLAELEAAVAAAFTRKQSAEVHSAMRHASTADAASWLLPGVSARFAVHASCRELSCWAHEMIGSYKGFCMQPCCPVYGFGPVVSRCVRFWPVIQVRTTKVRSLIASRLIVLPALVSQTDSLSDKHQHCKLSENPTRRTS